MFFFFLFYFYHYIRPHAVLDLLWEIVRKQMLNFSVVSQPELTVLLAEDESLASFAFLSSEDLLLRWINYHIRNAGSDLVINSYDLEVCEIFSACVFISTCLKQKFKIIINVSLNSLIVLNIWFLLLF